MRYLLAVAILAVPSFALAQCQANAPPQNQISALDLQLLQRNTADPVNNDAAIQRAVDRAIEQIMQNQGEVQADQMSAAVRRAVRGRVNKNVQASPSDAPPEPCADGECDVENSPTLAKARTTITKASFAEFKKRYTKRDKIVRN